MDFSTSATINFTGLTNYLNFQPTGLMADGTLDMLAIDTELLSDLVDDRNLDSFLLPDTGAEKMAVPVREGDVSVANETTLNDNASGDSGWGVGFSPAEPNYVGDSKGSVAMTSGSLDLYVHANLYEGDVL
jgi:hypothetical protein